MPPTDLLIEARTTGFPTSELQRFADLGLFDVDPSDSKRFVHAKLFIAHGRSWDHVISGSMNCTLPALVGPSLSRGNAEAGVYKRVPTGTAIAALGLDRYRAAPVQPKDLIDLAELNAVASGAREYVDGGTITLQFGRLIWKLIWPPCAIYPALPLKPVTCKAARSHRHLWCGIAAMITQCQLRMAIVTSGSRALLAASSSVVRQR